MILCVSLQCAIPPDFLIIKITKGQFSTSDDPNWATNPYNSAVSGGILSAPQDLWTNSQAYSLFQRRFRYIVARWGYSTSLMSWELWNEVDLSDAFDDNGAAANIFFNNR